MKQYNFIIESKLITVQAEDVEQGKKLAELTLKEMKKSIEELEISEDLEIRE